MDELDITRTYSPRDMEFVEDRFEVVLPADDESGASPTLTVIVTSEGILMDAYTQKPDEQRGTIGMTFDEWWEFIVGPTEFRV